jgi:CcmD family protein
VGYLVAAYAIAFVLIGGYVYYLVRQSRVAGAQMRELKRDD